MHGGPGNVTFVKYSLIDSVVAGSDADVVDPGDHSYVINVRNDVVQSGVTAARDEITVEANHN